MEVALPNPIFLSGHCFVFNPHYLSFHFSAHQLKHVETCKPRRGRSAVRQQNRITWFTDQLWDKSLEEDPIIDSLLPALSLWNQSVQYFNHSIPVVLVSKIFLEHPLLYISGFCLILLLLILSYQHNTQPGWEVEAVALWISLKRFHYDLRVAGKRREG